MRRHPVEAAAFGLLISWLWGMGCARPPAAPPPQDPVRQEDARQAAEVGGLINRLADGGADARIEALHGLDRAAMEIRDGQTLSVAVAPLTKVVEQEDAALRIPAARALATVAWRLGDQELMERALAALQAGLAEEDPDPRLEAAEGLVGIALRTHDHPLWEPAVPVLLAGLSDADGRRRFRAAMALAGLRLDEMDEESAAAVLQGLQGSLQDEDVHVRIVVGGGLAKLALDLEEEAVLERALPVVMAAAEPGQEAEARMNAVQVLSTLITENPGRPEMQPVIGFLARMMEKEDDSIVLAWLARSLAGVSDPRAQAAVEAYSRMFTPTPIR